MCVWVGEWVVEWKGCVRVEGEWDGRGMWVEDDNAHTHMHTHTHTHRW